MTRRESSPRTLAIAFGFILLAAAFTWPLADFSQPVLPRHDDPLFSVWRLAWVAHQLPRDVTHLFDTNIFYPEKHTLAYSDAMLLLGVIGAPFIWLGVPPLIVHNGLVITAFATAAVAAARLTRYFTPQLSAHVIAGVIFAFAPYRVAHLAHLELLWTAFIPLAWLALYRMLEQPIVTRAVGFGACVGLQGLCSVYYGVFLTIWLVPVLLLAPLVVNFRWSRQHVTATLVSVVTAVVLLSPYVAPYRSAHRVLGPRPASEISMFSARISDYWQPSPHNRLYSANPRLEQDERSLFVGVGALMLVVTCLVLVRSRVTLMLATVTLVAVDLSLGVHGILFPLITRAAPMLEGLRAPARFGVFALLGVAVMAALGLQRALAGVESTRRRRMLAALVALALVGEYWAAPVTTYEVPTRPAGAHLWLASHPPTVVATLPMPELDKLWGYETVFQYLSIFHWQRMVNGYSGHAPQSYFVVAHAVQDFPSDGAIDALRARGVEIVLLHERYSEPGQFNQYLYACGNPSWFSEVRTFRDFDFGRSAVCRLAPGVAATTLTRPTSNSVSEPANTTSR